MFIFLLVTFLTVKYFIKYLIPDSPAVVHLLNKRHKIIKSKFDTGGSHKAANYKYSNINFNVTGVINLNSKK